MSRKRNELYGLMSWQRQSTEQRMYEPTTSPLSSPQAQPVWASTDPAGSPTLLPAAALSGLALDRPRSPRRVATPVMDTQHGHARTHGAHGRSGSPPPRDLAGSGSGARAGGAGPARAASPDRYQYPALPCNVLPPGTVRAVQRPRVRPGTTGHGAAGATPGHHYSPARPATSVPNGATGSQARSGAAAAGGAGAVSPPHGQTPLFDRRGAGPLQPTPLGGGGVGGGPGPPARMLDGLNGRDPLAMTREEVAMTYGQARTSWDPDATTNTLSRTFRLGAPLTPSEHAQQRGQSPGVGAGRTSPGMDISGGIGAGRTSPGMDISGGGGAGWTSPGVDIAGGGGGGSGGHGGGGGGFSSYSSAPLPQASGSVESCVVCGEDHAPNVGCSPEHWQQQQENGVGITSRPSTKDASAGLGGMEFVAPGLLSRQGSPRQGDAELQTSAEVGEAIRATERKTDYIRMQREYVEERIRKLRVVPGYKAIDAKDTKPDLPDVKVALEAVRRRDEKAAQTARMLAAVAAAADARALQQQEGILSDDDSDTQLPMTEQSVSWRMSGPGTNSHERDGGQVPSGAATRREAMRISSMGMKEKLPGMPQTLSRKSSMNLTAQSRRPRRISSVAMRSVSVLELAEKMPAVNTATLFHPDDSNQLDTEDDAALEAQLKELLAQDAAPSDGTDRDTSTYSHLVKPALNSATNAFVVPGADEWDPSLTLSWANRGIGAKKMGVLRDTLLQNGFLTGLQLAGNNLNNACVTEVLTVLSSDKAPIIKQLDLSTNNNLNWRCAYALAQALGVSGCVDPEGPEAAAAVAAGAAAAAAAAAGTSDALDGTESPPPAMPATICELQLARLMLSGVKIGDRGAALLAGALKTNRGLRDLNLSRCSITDQGGAAIFEAIAGGSLALLNLSWNSLRGDSARAMHGMMQSNGSLQHLDLSYNGFSDQDAAQVLLSLTRHGTWRSVDLSHNNLGAGSALVLSEVAELLGRKAAEYISAGVYATQWDFELFPAGKVDSSGWLDPTHPGVKPPRTMYHCELGEQMHHGPLLIDVGGNPLGFAGMRQVIHALDSMSIMIEDAASEVVRKTPRGERPAGEDQDDELLLPPWPLHVVVASCNVDISDAPPEGCAIEGMDTFSPNPFLPSFMKATEAVMGKAGGPAAAGKAGGKEEKKGADKKGKKGRNDSDGAPAKEYFLSSQSQSMDLTSPAGKYQLDLSHPASWLMLRHIINLGKQLAMAVEKGLLAKGVALKISDVVLDGRPSNAGRLDSLADVTKGIVSFGVACPSLLLATEPSALTEQTLDWLIVTLTDKACGELWKLSVLQVACSHFYFTWEQALQFIDLFDAEMAISERLRASEMMYSRCTNPLLFWEEALPTLPALQVDSVVQRLGDFAACDVTNPAGRYMLNLSRSLDRFIACRLQEASALEHSWGECKYYYNWRNAILNGSPLTTDSLVQKLRDYTIPTSGTLRIDYVTYMVPDPAASSPAPEAVMADLFSKLRYLQCQFDAALIELRSEYLPNGELRSEQRAQAAKQAEADLATARQRKRMGLTSVMSLNKTVASVVREHSSGAGALDGEAGIALADMLAAEAERPWWAEAGFTAGKAMLARWQAVCLERITRQDNATVRRIGISSGGGDGTNTGGRRPSGSDVMGTTSRRQTGAGDAAAAGSRRQTGAGEVGVSRPGTAAAPGKKEGRPPSPEKKGKGGEEKKGGDKGRPGSPTKGGAGGGAVGTSVYPPPLQRTVGAHMTTKEAQEAEELAMQLLQVPRLSGCAEVLSHYSVKAVARVLHTYMRVDAVKGPAACAKLLECMSPLMAIKFLYPMYDVPLPLLPPEQRRLLLGACRPELLRVLSSLQSKVNEASLKRSRQMRVLLQCFAAHSVVTSAQLAVILRYLRFEQDRCTATVSLWSRVLNREFMYDAWQVLTNNEQRSIKYRLGPWHVWMTLARPQGLHFYIDMTDTEQKDIAKEVLKMAVKATTAAKASGGIMRGGHLLNLRGNGSAMSIPEDDKMWMMVESSYQSIEFDYAPSTEQVDARRASAAATLGRAWRSIVVDRAISRAAATHARVQAEAVAAAAAAAAAVAAADATAAAARAEGDSAGSSLGDSADGDVSSDTSGAAATAAPAISVVVAASDGKQKGVARVPSPKRKDKGR